MTIDEAYEELLKRGFGEPNFTYLWMNKEGTYDTYDIQHNQRPLTKHSAYIDYIDCGRGYLWHQDNDILHQGTEEYLAKKKISNITTFEELLSKLE